PRQAARALGARTRPLPAARPRLPRAALTRGRDGAVIFVPPLPELDATAARLQGHGVKVLG
ncbi:MAG TPA: hypothetical protein VIL41_06405, partial [Coriobacteriia bacterium]